MIIRERERERERERHVHNLVDMVLHSMSNNYILSSRDAKMAVLK